MRILHTADWHLGLTTHGTLDAEKGVNTRLVELRASVEWLASQVVEHEPDVVVLAGDIGHKRTISGPELAVVRSFLNVCRQSKASVVGCLGNHDQEWHPQRDAQLTSLLPTLYQRPQVTIVKEQVFLVLPYPNRAVLEASDIDPSEAYADLVANAVVKAAGKPVNVIGHFTVKGATYSGQAQPNLMTGQDITIARDALVQPGVQRVMMGHIHKAQGLTTDGIEIVYPGSLMSLTFGEENDPPKGAALHDTDVGGWESLVNPHSPAFITVQYEDEALPDNAPAGSYVRMVAESKIPDGVKANVQGECSYNGWRLCGFVERVVHTQRSGAAEIAKALTDEEIVKAYCVQQAQPDMTKHVLDVMEEADVL